MLAFLHQHSILVLFGMAVTGFGAFSPSTASGLLQWAAGAWSTSATNGFTLTAAQMAAAADTFLTLTANNANAVATPTAALLLQGLTAALGFVPVSGFTWKFTVSNQGNNTVTLSGGTGVTINGTATVATTVNRTWLCTITNSSNPSAAAVTLQNVGSATN